MNLQLTPTLENYLETIFELQRERPFARVRDIANTLSVAKSAVTAALQSLSQKGFVNYEPYEPVTLTSAGRKKGESIALRHRVLTDFLENVLGLEAPRADSMACGMEHAVDQDALERFVCFLAFVGRPHAGGGNWLKQFQDFLERDDRDQMCEQCIKGHLQSIEQKYRSATD